MSQRTLTLTLAITHKCKKTWGSWWKKKYWYLFVQQSLIQRPVYHKHILGGFHLKRHLLPLLSPLNFFSSLRSCVSNSLSNSICSIWASMRSLEVSTLSTVMTSSTLQSWTIFTTTTGLRLSLFYANEALDFVDVLCTGGEDTALLIQLLGQLFTHNISQGAGGGSLVWRSPWVLRTNLCEASIAT